MSILTAAAGAFLGPYAPSEPPRIFRFVGDSLASKADTYSHAAASNLAEALGPLAISGVTLFIAVYGALVIAGKIQQPFQDFMVKAVKIILVAAVALNAGNYVSYVADAVGGLESFLVTALKIPGSTSGTTNTYEQLDISLGAALDLVNKCQEKIDRLNIFTEFASYLGYSLAGGCILIGTVLFFVVGGATIIVTKFMLAIVIAVGPIFVLALMFPATAGFFDRWLAQAITYVLTIVLVAVVMTMGISIFSELIGKTNITDGSPLFAGVQVLFVSLILAYVLYQVSSMASALSGGASMAALTLRQVAGFATGTAGAATGTAKMLNPTSSRLDPKTGHQTSSSRTEHMAMGRTVLNPAYNRALMARMSNGWKENSVKKN